MYTRAFIVIAFLTALFPGAVLAERITAFKATLDVKTDASVAVAESITYDFEGASRHGIFRAIQERYKDRLGGTEDISINDVRVTDEYGTEYPYSISRSDGYLRIKIGDPDTMVSGVKTYAITYTVRDAIGYFTDHDEIYWNVTGNEWEVPIDSAQAGVWTPTDSTSHACYVGAVGSTVSCTSEARRDGANKPIVLFSTEDLASHEGLTIAVGLPKGVLIEPTAVQRTARLLLNNILVLTPIPVLALLYLLWSRYGRDARGRGTVIPEYDAPAGMTPFQTASIVRQGVKTSDVSAEIIRLAVLGYLHITRIDTKTLGIFSSTDYRIDRLKTGSSALSPEETILLEALFKEGDSVLTSELKKNQALYTAATEIKKSMNMRMVSEGYYRANPTTIMTWYLVAGILVIALAFIIVGTSLSLWSALAVGLSGICIIVFSFIMPALTKKGALLREQILGLKDYLQIAEKNRLDFHNAPEKSPELFEKLLPFAMVLGVSTAWAKEFEGIYTQPPGWYSGGVYPVFSPTAFADEVNSFSTAAAALASPTSGSGGSGGGGFSGGGFGGGGGGSW